MKGFKAGVGLILFGGCFLCCATGVGFLALKGSWEQQRAAKEYLRADECTVVHSEVTTSVSSGSKPGQKSSVSYDIQVKYRYRVHDRSYESERWAYQYDNGKATVEAAVAALPAGARCTAYYDPHDPSESVLHRAETSILWAYVTIGAMIVAGLVTALFGVFALLRPSSR